MWRAFCWILGALGCFVMFVGEAHADESRRAGTVRLETSSGARGPLELLPSKDGYEAELVIANDGKEPLIVSRIAVRGDSSEPRVPPKLQALVDQGSLPITLAPGASRKARIVWTPERTARLRELFGHVLVTTSDEGSGEVAMGVRARERRGAGSFGGHLLSWLLAVPLLGALGSFVVRLFHHRDDRTHRRIAITALAMQTVLAAAVYRAFVPDVSRMDGNDGLQLIERAVWIRRWAMEFYLGVDGIAAAALFVTSAVVLLGVMAEHTIARGEHGYYTALLLLDASLMAALVAMDGMLFVFCIALAVASASVLIGGWGGPARHSAAMRLLLPGFFAVILLAIAIVALSRHAQPSFLVDGTNVTTTFSLPELARMDFEAQGGTLVGAPLARTCFVLVVMASIVLLAAFPAHGWLTEAILQAPTATGVTVATALPTLGLAALLRIGVAVLPEAMRWGSGVLVALGAISSVYGAFAALEKADLRKLATSAATSQAGFVLLGAGSLTPQGLSGAVVLGTTRALGCGVFLLLVASIARRANTSDAERLTGVARPMPAWASALGIAALAQSGVLGLGGAWGPMLAVWGALPSYAPLAVAAAVALVVIGVAHLSAISKIAFGTLDPKWKSSALLEPFGGRFPDLSTREWTSIAPLVVLVLLLGIWPAPIVAITSGTVRDLANAVSPPGPNQVAAR
jgi:NADH-quinone oxidoreductase subunit M